MFAVAAPVKVAVAANDSIPKKQTSLTVSQDPRTAAVHPPNCVFKVKPTALGT